MAQRIPSIIPKAILSVLLVLVVGCDDGPLDPPPVPGLSSTSVVSAVRGTTIEVTLTGSHFVPGGTSVSVDGSGVTVGSVEVMSETTLTLELVVAAGAPLGERSITVTTAGGTSPALPFTVLPPVPTVTHIAPASGVRGEVVEVTVSGSAFVPGATSVEVDGTGVTVEDVEVVDESTLTANLAIAENAPLETVEVSVSTAGGTGGAHAFTILPRSPTLENVAPDSGVQGTTVPVTLTGTNFLAGATSVEVGGPGIEVSGLSVTDPTTLTADLVIAPDAALGGRALTVSTAGGTSDAVTFRVLPAAPTLSGVDPGWVVSGTTATVTLYGTNFVLHGTSVEVGDGLSVARVDVLDAKRAIVELVVEVDAVPGDRVITVTTAGGTSDPATLSVLPPPPLLTGITPATGRRGTTVTVTLTGAEFIDGATTVAVNDVGVAVNNVSVTSDSTLTADLTIGNQSGSGLRAVTVITPGGEGGGVGFTIQMDTLTFVHTGGRQEFSVPAGSRTVIIQAYGAQGGAGSAVGGLGGMVTATVAVAGGEVLGIYVGGQGGAAVTPGFNGGGAGGNGPGNDGGGGGGASDVRQGGDGLAHRIVVAGGGGGGGAGPTGGSVAGAGGAGGGLTAQNGSDGSDGAQGGGGGTQSAGGDGGNGSSGGDDGDAGVLGAGGKGGGNTVDEGGGGGGGYYGGGGGGEEASLAMGGAGGGGGSSYVIGTATDVVHQQGVRAGDGAITIVW